MNKIMEKISDSSRIFALLLAAGMLMTFNACAPVGPDYTAPDQESPQEWSSELGDGLNAESPDSQTLAHWWETLGDETLNALMERAVSGNLDLKAARARVREARARSGVSNALLYPTLDTGAAALKQRFSGSSGNGNEIDLFVAGFDAGWELDVFGGVRRQVEAARADLGAGEEEWRDVMVSLLAEVARNYLEVRTYQSRLKVAADSIKSQEVSAELNRSRFSAGIIDELALQQALYNLEQTRAQVPVLQTGLAAAQNRLTVLLGLPPGKLKEELAKSAPVPVAPVSVAVGVPAETLRRRPDIRQAERNLAAATARIGVATADLYPKFRLSGSIGLEAIDLGDLPNWSSRTSIIRSGISWNIFDAGAVRRTIEIQSARQEQALVFYEKSVLTALEEVENALVAYVREQQRRESLKAAEQAAEKALSIARDKYQSGLVDFSNVLDAQRALYGFQDALAVSDGAVTAGFVRIYKALGGGWLPIGAQPPENG